ncbi:MAG: hypothetical protein ACC700_17415 [Anaerolineales bacterium]
MPNRDNRPFRFQRYQHLAAHRDAIFKQFREIADRLDTEGYRENRFGMLGGSGAPPVLSRRVRKAIDEGSAQLTPLASLDDRIREIVKSVYGDEWDAAAVSSAEAGLWVTFDALVSVPMAARGLKYQSVYATPFERHTHHQASYGAPFPPYLKDHVADRGVTAGEMGLLGKRLENVSVIFSPLSGARYENHGIKYAPAYLLLETEAEASAAKFRLTAERHLDRLAAIVSMGYDSPGYGYGEIADGAPKLQRALGELAAEWDLPYIVDNARGTPFLGLDPRITGAGVVIYSTDKAFGGPTAGLIIGQEKFMVPIRRAMGMAGNRWGTTSSHGKAGYVMADPGKEGLLGLIGALEGIMDDPDELTAPVDTLFELTQSIAAEELGDIVEHVVISSSRNALAVEVNYERSWRTEYPIPIFPIEDFYSGANLIQYGLSGAGIGSPLCYDANIVIGPLSNLCKSDGVLHEGRAAFALRTMFQELSYLTKRFNEL